jgi:UDP-N-acetylglucosamine 2-epimerase
MTVLCVIGTRPEAIKMAPVVAELRRHPQVNCQVCATGQHREMLEPILDLFGIRPDFDLKVMRPGQTHSMLTARLLEGLDGVVGQVRPDWVLAQGDTTSVLAASLVANFHQTKFGHVEAGLRTGEKNQPFPEELNRRIADIGADARFAPTQRARECLLREGCESKTIHVTGNTIIDALIEIASKPFNWDESPYGALTHQKQIVLVTAHRRENLGEPLREICSAIHELVMTEPGSSAHFIFPVHRNPDVHGPVHTLLGGLPNVSLLDPLDYLSMVQLMKRAALILTDSGGIQEEAPSFGVPVLVMRETTERPEGLDGGLVQLIGTNRQRITEAANRLLRNPPRLNPGVPGPSPYGDGRAAARIVATILGRI